MPNMAFGSPARQFSSSDLLGSLRDAAIAAIAAAAAYFANRYDMPPEVQAAIVTLGVWGLKAAWKWFTDTRRMERF